jgi:hypothetical protein
LGMLGMWGRSRHWLWQSRKWQWLVKVDRTWHALCIKCRKFITKYFFLANVLVLWCQLRFGQEHFSLAELFYLGGHLRLTCHAFG